MKFLPASFGMNPFPVVFASWRRYPGTALGTVLLVALAVTLGTVVSLMEPSLRRGATAAADRFDLVVGAPGSETQLVLSAVYLDTTPLPLLSAEVGERVRREKGVAWSSPLLLGDVWKKHPIVGVSEPFLEGQGTFSALSDAWVGALVPLEPGDTFHGSHGAEGVAGHTEHGLEYVVKGRLAPTGTPWDRALLVSAASIWQDHGVGTKSGEGEIGAAGRSGAAGMEPDTRQAMGKKVFGEQRAEIRAEIHPLVHAEASGPMSALVIKPSSVADAYRLRGTFRTELSVALFPAEVLLRLYGMMGDAQKLFSGMAWLAQGAVLLAVLMGVFAGMERRRATLGVLRALGASRAYGALALWLEVFVMLAAGGLLGLFAGWGAAAWAAGMVEAATGVAVVITPASREAALLLAVLAFGGLAALLPAWSGYRLPVVAGLRS